MGSLPRALSCWWAAQVCIWVPSRRTSAAALCRLGPGTATGKDAADRSRSRLRKRQRTGALQDLAESARRMRNREASLECGGKRWRHAAFGGRSSPAIRRRIRRLWRRFFNLPCCQVALGWASTSPTCPQFRSAGGSPTRDTASLPSRRRVAGQGVGDPFALETSTPSGLPTRDTADCQSCCATSAAVSAASNRTGSVECAWSPERRRRTTTSSRDRHSGPLRPALGSARAGRRSTGARRRPWCRCRGGNPGPGGWPARRGWWS